MNVLEIETFQKLYVLVYTILLFIATSSIIIYFLLSYRYTLIKGYKNTINTVHIITGNE